jgi:FkbM family methyltransferase
MRVTVTHSLTFVEEVPRVLVRRWPFPRGDWRLMRVFSAMYTRFQKTGVVGKIDKTHFYYPPGFVGSNHFWWKYEPEIHSAVRRLLSPEATFLDIGSHYGWYAAFALNKCARVIACEPSPENAAILKMQAALNPGKHLIVDEVAVTSSCGMATLHLSDETGWNTILPEFRDQLPREQPFAREHRSVVVRTATLDALFAKHEISGKVVCKIDSEGAEWDILSASRTALPTVSALVFECTGGAGVFEERAKNCVGLLKRLGFSVRVIEPDGLRAWTARDAQRMVNLLAER